MLARIRHLAPQEQPMDPKTAMRYPVRKPTIGDTCRVAMEAEGTAMTSQMRCTDDRHCAASGVRRDSIPGEIA
jgi:hypothetical protein